MSLQAKAQTTECVPPAQSTGQGLKQLILVAFYALTKYLPRKLPENGTEFEAMKAKLVNYYGLEDTADSWATVAGQITSTPPTSMRKSYGDLVNAAKRKKVNLIAQNQKILAYSVLEGKLEAAMMELTQHERAAEKARASLQNGAHNNAPEVPVVQSSQAGVVSDAH